MEANEEDSSGESEAGSDDDEDDSGGSEDESDDDEMRMVKRRKLQRREKIPLKEKRPNEMKPLRGWNRVAIGAQNIFGMSVYMIAKLNLSYIPEKSTTSFSHSSCYLYFHY